MLRITAATALMVTFGVLQTSALAWQQDRSGYLGKTLRPLSTSNQPRIRSVPATDDESEKAEEQRDAADLTGQWKMTMPSGVTRPMMLKPHGDGQWELSRVIKGPDLVMGGIYRFRGIDLTAVKPNDDRMKPLIWRRTRPGLLVLIEEPTDPLPTGASYRGCILEQTSRELPTPPVKQLTIDKDRVMRMDGKIVTMNDLAALKALQVTPRIEISAHKSTPTGVVSRVIQALQKSGIDTFSLKVLQEES